MNTKSKTLTRCDKLHIIVSQLLYPAFLGALIYSLFDQDEDIFSIFERSPDALIFSILIFIHYSIDFIYVNDFNVRSIYNYPRFVIDVILVFIIYLSAKESINFSEIISYYYIGILLAAFKFTSFLWELAGDPSDDKKSAIKFYLGFFALYLLCALCLTDPVVVLCIVLLSDVVVSFFWERVRALKFP